MESEYVDEINYPVLVEILESSFENQQLLIGRYERALASIVFLYEEETVDIHSVKKMYKFAKEALESN